MFIRSITRLTLALIIVVTSLLFITSITATAVTTTASARPRADLIVNPGESIQAAIDAASDGDTIIVNAGTYTESLTLSKPVSLTGVNSDTTIIHAMAGQRVLTVTGATISNSVVISGLTFTGGYAGNGGGLYADHDVTMINMRFISNTSGTDGGGLYVSDAATLTNVDFISNTAQQSGGGLFSSNAVTMTSGTFIGNMAEQGGGARIRHARLSNVQFEQNSAPNGNGGGLNAVYLSISDTRFVNNSANWAAGLFAAASAQVMSASFENNHAVSGGGAMLTGSTLADRAKLFVWNTQFISNTATSPGSIGGAVYYNSNGVVHFTNVVLARNHAQAYGAALFLNGSEVVILKHLTIADASINPLAAITVFSNWPAYIIDSIITNHAIGIQSLGIGDNEDYNLFYGNLTNTVGVITGAHSLIGDPRFVDPAHDDYHLIFGSASVDHGVDAGVYTDLDGNVRPQGAGFDIGAYESPYATTSTDLALTQAVTPTFIAPGQTVSYTLAFTNQGSYTATGVLITDSLPPNFISLTVASSGAPITQAAQSAWQVADLAPGDGGIITLSGALNVPWFTPNIFTNTAHITAATVDTDTTNNTASAAVTICGTIQCAIDAAHEGDTLLIPSGLYTESLTLSKPVSLTGVNSDTTIIHALAGQRVLTVTGATIGNSVVISGLMFTGGELSGGTGCPAYCGGGILMDDISQPILCNIRIAGNSAPYAGGVRAKNLLLINSMIADNTGGGAIAYTATVTGGEFNNNVGNGGLAAEVLTVSGARFISNTAYEGGGVYVNQSAVIINATFEDNRCTGDYCGGGGLHAAQYFPGALTVSNTIFVNNSAYDGGGVFSYNKSITVENSSLISNTAHNHGGGIWVRDSSLVMRDTQVISNSANNGGGGAFAYNEATVVNSRFENNDAGNSGNGGGLYTNGPAVLTDSQFLSNTAASGGGVWAGGAFLTGGRFEGNISAGGLGGGLSTGPLTMSGTQLVSNTAMCGGGAFAISPVIINGGRFERNTSNDSGGALCLSTLTLTGTEFIGNSAATKGGAIFYSYTDADPIRNGRIINALFSQNSANAGGTALFVHAKDNVALLHATITGTNLQLPSAIAISQGTLNVTNTIIANHAIGISNTGGTVAEDYNLFYSNITNTVGVITGAHSLNGDPRFVDPAHDDYHLLFGSAAIDHGVDAGIYTDLDGIARPIGAGFDIGAYEDQGMAYRVFLPLIQK